MGTYKYKLGVTYLVKDQEPIQIDSSNVTGFAIHRDFRAASIMPNVFLSCKLDKNLIDKLIEGQQNDLIKLSIGKVNVATNEQIAEPYIDTVCYYKIIGDKNYNKDKDYREGSNPDVYKDVMIGMASKDLIERNKKVINFTVQNSDMLNTVLQVTEGIPLVIEPFKYNKHIDQLIIPPKESVKDTIAFLNDIAVFYDTQYRFYMDFNASYLVSSSGEPIPMIGEEYSSVNIQVRNPIEYSANELGMTTDEKSKCYILPVNAESTNYNVDNDTDKEFNKIIGIIDPSRKNALPNVMGDAIASATNIINTVKGAVEGAKSTVINGINDINRSFSEIKYNNRLLDKTTNNFTGVHNNAISILDGLLSKYNTKENKGKLDGLTSCRDILLSKHQGCLGGKTNMNTSVGQFDNFRINTQSIGYNITSITSFTNGVKLPNIPDNVNGMTGLTTGNSKDVSQNLALATSMLTNTSKASNAMLTNMTSYGDNLSGMNDIILSEKTTVDSKGTPTTTVEKIDLEPLRELAPDVFSCSNAAKPLLEGIVGRMSSSKSITSQFKGVNSSISESINNLSGVKNKLKDQISNISKSWKETQNDLRSQVEKMTTMKGLGISDISQLKDISKITDLSSVGRLGVTNIQTILGLPHNEDSTIKAKMVVLNNDDPNKIKNIQSQLEIQGTVFSMTKMNLDNSVFTINKEYTISNTEQRKDKNGRLLLVQKSELYKREDDLFNCNTILNFNRLPDKK